jgi:hypothetical protein
MHRPIRTFLFALMLVLAADAHAIRIRGIVRDASSRLPLRGATVTLEGERVMDVCVTHIDGFYRFDIRAGQEVRIRFERSGRVTRHVVIDVRAVPREWNDELDMSTDMRLFPSMCGLDSAMLVAPAGIAKWDGAEENMVWDEQRSAPLVQRWNKLLERHLAAHPEERPSPWQRRLSKAYDLANEWALVSVAVLLLCIHLAMKQVPRQWNRTVRVLLFLAVLACAVFLVLELRSAAGPLRYVAFMALVTGAMAVFRLVEIYLLSGVEGTSSDTPEHGYLLEQGEVIEEVPEDVAEETAGAGDITPGRSRNRWGKLNMLAFFAAIILLITEGRRGLENTLDAGSLAGLGAGVGLVAAVLLAWVRTPPFMRSYRRVVLRNGGVFWVVLPVLCMAALSFLNRTFPQGGERCRTWAVVDISRSRNINVTVSWDGERERLEMPRAIKEQLTTLDSLHCCTRKGLLGFDHVYSFTPVLTDDPR